MKRIFDFMLALIGLFVSLPLWVLFGWAIFLEDGMPIFYAQERIGRDRKLFNNLKFRSMIKNAESNTGPIQAKENDPRVIKIGRFLRKTALDELPQLINILKGDMSFVGPRPLRPREIEQYSENGEEITRSHFFSLRSSVTPGLTGIAQVYAPRDISRREKIEYDLWYIKNQSFTLDFALILKSFWVTLNRKWDTKKKGFARKI